MGIASVIFSSTRRITIENTGSDPATILISTFVNPVFSFFVSSIPFVAGGPFPGVTGTCGSVIAVGETCEIIPAFIPTTASNIFNGTLTINYNSGAGTGTQSVVNNITGTSTP